MDKAVIGITTDKTLYNHPGYPDPYDMDFIASGLAKAVTRAGGLPVLIPVNDPQVVKDYVHLLDGLILTGGADIVPKHYGEHPHYLLTDTKPDRDDSELSLAKGMIQAGKAVLGICRGFQLINVIYGGTLWQDLSMNPDFFIKHKQTTRMEYPIHTVDLVEDSHLAGVVGPEEMGVNSLHHQAIKDLGQDLKATAYAPDGLVEAFEKIDNETSVVGVQWHPETIYEIDIKHMAIFEDLIDRALERRDSKVEA